MNFEQALKEKSKLSSSVSSKTYRICPNPKSDKNGLFRFLADLKDSRILTDEDAKKYSSNDDFDILVGHYY